jgi:CHAT domain-containing protein
VLDALPAQRLVHIATHGFFGGSEGSAAGTRGVVAAAPAPRVNGARREGPPRNPLLESGLAFAGANLAASSGAGRLTAEELLGGDLRRAQLVVLSACETGLGEIQGNEGVYGLQRAFKIAGAKYLIMSLWQVPDKQTSLLMTTFYKKWLEEKMTIPEAFHAAQKQLREIGLDPYQWAGFVLVE